MIISLIIKKIKKIFLNFTNKLSFLNTNTIETKEEQVTIEKDNDVEETKEEEIIVEKDTNVKKTNNNFLNVPSSLEGFKNTNTEVIIDENNREIIHFYGELTVNKEDYICPNCGHKMHIKSNRKVDLKHVNFGPSLTHIHFRRNQFCCEKCKHTQMQNISFKSTNHFITIPLEQYITDLLSLGTFTILDISRLTGVGRNIIKEIDLKRLKNKYTIDGKQLIKPEQQARFLGIDEFKLHENEYATHIIDIETGHILWIQETKKKQIVYDFIEHVGLEWMSKVEAVACDMNAGFANAFTEKCPHIKIVFDHFHVVENFNEIVISNVYKEEQFRLRKEKRIDEANKLKKSRYILTSSRKTLLKKDKEAEEGKIIRKGSEIFKSNDIKRKDGYVSMYDELIKDNELLFTMDLIKAKLDDAYRAENSTIMKQKITDIIGICNQTGNKNCIRFANLLLNHIDGIANFADYHISSGKIEGINNKIKTVRRIHYGLPDDEYFFLTMMDISRTQRRL